MVSSKISNILEILQPGLIDKVIYQTDTAVSDTIKKFNIVLLDCFYNGVTYYIYNKIGTQYYFILINSYILMDIITILSQIEAPGEFSFIVKKDIDTTVYKYGGLEQIRPEDIELEAYINYCMFNKISLFNILKAYNICSKNDDLKNTYDFITEMLLKYFKYRESYENPSDLKSYTSMKSLIKYFFKTTIQADTIMRIKSPDKFRLIEELTEYFKTNFNSEFVNDLFRPELSGSIKYLTKLSNVFTSLSNNNLLKLKNLAKLANIKKLSTAKLDTDLFRPS